MFKHSAAGERGTVRYADIVADAHAYSLRDSHRSILGINADPAANVTTSQTISARAILASSRSFDMTDACFSSEVRRSVVSESFLANELGVNVIKTEKIMIWPDGEVDPIVERNGLYFVTVMLQPVPAEREVSAARIRVDDNAALWAARMATDAKGTLRASRATRGIGIDTISKAAAEVIDNNAHLRLQQSRRRPVQRAIAATERAPRPGHTFVFDGWGPHAAPSPLNNHTYQFHGVCQYSSFGYTSSNTRHTGDDWKPFIRNVYNDAKAAGHTPKVFIFDSGTDLVSVKEWCEAEFGVSVRIAPPGHHEGVGTAEVNNDVLTRVAEASLQRAELKTSYLIPARVYAQYVVNRRPVEGQKESRYQRYYGLIPSFDADRLPYLFGTEVSYHEDEPARGPKGSLERPRAVEGTLVGFDGASYLVHKKRGGVGRPRHVYPLNEAVLVRRGAASGVTLADAATQTPPPGTELTPPPPVPRVPRPAPPTLSLPKGTRVSVVWGDAKSNTTFDYLGTIDDFAERSGKRYWRVLYDGYADDTPTWHPFETTTRKWHVVSPPQSADQQQPADPASPPPDQPPPPQSSPPSPPQPAEAPASPRPSGPATRAQTRANRALTAAVAATEGALEASTCDAHVEVFNTALYATLGDAANRFECSSADERSTPGAYASPLAQRQHRTTVARTRPTSAPRRRSETSTSPRHSESKSSGCPPTKGRCGTRPRASSG